MNYISLNELFTLIVASFPFVYIGLSSGFGTEYIYQKNINETMSNNEISWIGSSGFMFSFISCIASGYFIDKFGRKIIFYFVNGINTIGWMIISKTKHFLIGRFLISLGTGAAFETGIYLAEILQPRHRGIFLNLLSVLDISGDLLIYFTSYYISVETISFLLSIFAFILLICTLLIPESPYWYMLKNKRDKAIESLVWLRKTYRQTVDNEINEIERNMSNTSESTTHCIKIISNVRWWKIFLRFFIYTLLLGFMGFDIIIAYAVQIITKFNRTQIDNRIIANIFISATFVSSTVIALIMEKYSRISLVKCANAVNIFLLILGGFCNIFVQSTILSFITLICFCLFGTTISIASYGLPWTMIAENLPTDLRATIYSTLNAVYFLIFSGVIKFFPVVLEFLPITCILWLIALISFFNYIFVHNFIKETRGIVLN